MMHLRRGPAFWLSVGALIFQTTALAANGPKAQPHLKFARPLHGHNALLNAGGDDGDDDTSTVANPSSSALCQSFLHSATPYGNPFPNVDIINGDTTVTNGSQAGCQAPQNETTIAVNPTNPQNLVAGTNDYRVYSDREGGNDDTGWAYTSFDGGTTWTNLQLPHLTYQTGATGALADMDSAGDPAIAFGPNNTVFYANLVISRFNDGSGIVVSTSHDGGRTWSEPSIVRVDGVDTSGQPVPTSVSNDKEWIAVDQNTGTVYVTWTAFGPSDFPIVMAKSTDGGLTWSSPVRVNPAFTPGGITAYSQGSIPQVGRNGELYVAYESSVCQSLNCDQPGDHDAIIMAKSTNGGMTFQNTEVAVDYDFPANEDVGRETLTGENFRVNSFPQFTVDPVTGRLYVTWADDRNGEYDAMGNFIKTNGDVLIASSSNGTEWTHPDQVGSTADEVFPAVAAYNGRVAITFYTRAYDPGGINLDYAYIQATGLGNIKQADLTRITTQSENPQVQFTSIGRVSGQVLQGVFIGDYTAVAMGSDFNFHPCWTDFRGKPGVTTPNQDAYTQSISLR